MEEFLRRDALLDDIAAAAEHGGMGKVVADTLTRFIKRQPTVFAGPVVHGAWLVTDAYPHRLYCSVCHQTALPNAEYLEHWGITFEACPHCRAVMDRGGI